MLLEFVGPHTIHKDTVLFPMRPVVSTKNLIIINGKSVQYPAAVHTAPPRLVNRNLDVLERLSTDKFLDKLYWI